MCCLFRYVVLLEAMNLPYCQYLAYNLKLQEAHLIREFDPFVDSSDNTITTFIRNSIVTPNCNLVECAQPLEDIHIQFLFKDQWC
jgi:hypothetical protein